MTWLWAYIGYGEPVYLVERDQVRQGHWRLVQLGLVAGACLLWLAIAGNAGRGGHAWAMTAYWIGLTALFVPLAAHASWPGVERSERIGALLMLTLGLYAVKLLNNPLGFAHFDEFIHAVTTEDILERGVLFAPNPILPISPLYPGLEIIVAAISKLSGLSVFASAVILIGVGRAICVVGLFLLFERMTASAWAAAIACLVYAGQSNFTLFHAQFAYESLAIALLVLVMLCVADDFTAKSRFAVLAVPTVLLAGLTTTHHLTSYVCMLLLFGAAALEFINRNKPERRTNTLLLAIIALVMAAGWSKFAGGPIESYFGPQLEGGAMGLFDLFKNHTGGRRLFVANDGARLPALLRLIGIISVIILCISLARGFFRTLTFANLKVSLDWRAMLSWNRSLLILFTLLTLLYPVSLAFRLTGPGWEIGNRMGSFVYLGVAVVVAIALIASNTNTAPTRLSAGQRTTLLTIIFLGGVVAGPGRNIVPAPYAVAADSLSVEPLGIEAATWTRQWLGEHNRFASDRINRLLLAWYGRQRITTTLYDRVDTSTLLFSTNISEDQLFDLKRANLDFLLVDLRLSTALPSVGVYFESGEDTGIHRRPPDPKALLKFNASKLVNRLYDNGPIIIYDVRALRDAP